MAKIIAAAIAFAVAIAVSARLAIHTMNKNRQNEFDQNKKGSAFSKMEIDWTVIHIRDDLGSIFSLLVITNGLLAAILATLMF